MELKLPLDFQRLPEFRKLAMSLKEIMRPVENVPLVVETVTLNLFVRLWVELGYFARATSRPGCITNQEEPLLKQSLADIAVIMGDEVDLIKLYEDAGLLTLSGQTWYCELFASQNSHLAGNFKSKEERGAAASALERNRRRIAQDADHQAMLLPPEIFTKRDGSRLEGSEVNRCMVMIKTLDHCLAKPGRNKGDYTPGLISDANAANEPHTEQELRAFYVWLSLHRDHPRIPQSAEKILAEFATYFELSREEKP